MTEPNAAAWSVSWFGLLILAVLEQLHPGAASGASFGCFFLLAFPDPVKKSWFEVVLRKMGLLIFSWGWGYGMGSGHAAEGGHYAIAIACGHAAVAATLFGSLNLMFRNDGPMPPWLSAIVDRIPILRRGNNDGT